MAALTAARNTLRKGDEAINTIDQYPVEASKKIYQGALVVLNSSGNAEPATSATGKKAVGRAEALADNSSGAAAAINVSVRAGTFKFLNSSAGDALAKADVGSVCYAADDQTVAKTDNSGARSPAGVVQLVDSDGVWVEVRATGASSTKSVDQGGTGATSLTAHGLLVGEGTAAVAALAVATNGQLIVGQTGADPAPKTVSGDVTIDLNGVTAIGAQKVVESMMKRQADGAILIGQAAADMAAHALSGDVTMTDAGVTAIGANKVTGPALAASAQRILMAAAGAAAPGAVTLTGAKVGDTVIAVQNFTTGAMQAAADFEATITVANQIQQVTAADLHLDKLTVFLVAKS